MKIIHQIILEAIVGIVVLTAIAALGMKPQAPQVNFNMIGATAVPEVQATIYSAAWCGPCKSYLKALNAELPKDGWIIRNSTDKDSATAHVIVNKEESPEALKKYSIESYPTTIIRRNRKEVKRFIHPVSPDDLVKAINNAAK